MLHRWRSLASYPINALLRSLFVVAFAVVYTHVPATAVVVVPSSNCYALDNDSRLVDFTDWIGEVFEYDGKSGGFHALDGDLPISALRPEARILKLYWASNKGSDMVVRFCKDVESRSQAGYVDFGRFTTSRTFLAGSKPIDFIQKFYNGDLRNCETNFDMMGRTAKVNIICGHCLHRACKDIRGCICSVTYDEKMCSVVIELAIHCAKSGSRVFKGFTVGFHPRSSEVVYNGMTQLGFEKPHNEFSFGTEQIHVSLYLSAISSLSSLVGKPIFKVYPAKGLDITVAGSGADGVAPTTLSPTVLNVNWRCEIASDDPYEVNILIPVKGYDPIEFTFTKTCDYQQGKDSNPMRGWATFGILSCIFIIFSSVLCCGGFIYKTHVHHQYGLDALPGMTILSAFLDAVSRPSGYTRGDDLSGNHVNQASWERAPGSAQTTQRTNDRSYGTL